SARSRNAWSERAHEACFDELLAIVGEPSRAHRPWPQGPRVRLRRGQHRQGRRATWRRVQVEKRDGAGADARDHRGRRLETLDRAVTADPRVPRRAVPRAAAVTKGSLPARALPRP